MNTEELVKDIKELIETFDIFLDNMEDRNALDIDNNEYDAGVNNLVAAMKRKYSL